MRGTAKQDKYLADIIEQAKYGIATGQSNPPENPADHPPNARLITEYVLLLSIPADMDDAAASSAIDDLQSGVVIYAKRNQDWARPILEGLESADFSAIQEAIRARYAKLDYTCTYQDHVKILEDVISQSI